MKFKEKAQTFKEKAQSVLGEKELHMLDHFTEAYVLCRIRGNPELMLRAVQGGNREIEVIADELASDLVDLLIVMGRALESVKLDG